MFASLRDRVQFVRVGLWRATRIIRSLVEQKCVLRRIKVALTSDKRYRSI